MTDVNTIITKASSDEKLDRKREPENVMAGHLWQYKPNRRRCRECPAERWEEGQVNGIAILVTGRGDS
jgi:hypothetical protein